MLLKQEDGKVSGIRSVALEEIPEKHELISALAVSGISGNQAFDQKGEVTFFVNSDSDSVGFKPLLASGANSDNEVNIHSVTSVRMAEKLHRPAAQIIPISGSMIN